MVNGRIYVGLTQRNAFVRFTEHLYSAGALALQQRAGVKPDLKLDTPLYRDMVWVAWQTKSMSELAIRTSFHFAFDC